MAGLVIAAVIAALAISLLEWHGGAGEDGMFAYLYPCHRLTYVRCVADVQVPAVLGWFARLW